MHCFKRVALAIRRHEVLLTAARGEMTCVQAAEVLGLSSRQTRRIKKSYELHGVEVLLDHRFGVSAWNRVNDEIKQKVISLYRDQYFNFNVKHFHEKLQSEHAWFGKNEQRGAY